MEQNNVTQKKVSSKKREKGKSNILTRFIPRWLSLPLIIIITFLVIMIFYGDNSYLKNKEYSKKIDELKKEIKANRDSAQYYRQKSHELTTDKETLEKIAREQYGMKRDNEDVYITDIP